MLCSCPDRCDDDATAPTSRGSTGASTPHRPVALGDRTVHGSERHATRELAALVDEVACARLHAGTVAELLDRWFETASPSWSATTFVENRSVVHHHRPAPPAQAADTRRHLACADQLPRS
jgi:hypothetical protein